MFNPFTRFPLYMKKIFRLTSLKVPSYTGIYGDGEEFNVYIQRKEPSQDGEHIEGLIDEGRGILKFKGNRNQSKLELTATYYKSCVRKNQIPKTFRFKAAGEDIFKGTATSKELLTYNFGTGYGLLNVMEKPFVIVPNKSATLLKEHVKNLPKTDVHQVVEYCH